MNYPERFQTRSTGDVFCERSFLDLPCSGNNPKNHYMGYFRFQIWSLFRVSTEKIAAMGQKMYLHPKHQG
jgi:hypothetical protein